MYLTWGREDKLALGDAFPVLLLGQVLAPCDVAQGAEGLQEDGPQRMVTRGKVDIDSMRPWVSTVIPGGLTWTLVHRGNFFPRQKHNIGS